MFTVPQSRSGMQSFISQLKGELSGERARRDGLSVADPLRGLHDQKIAMLEYQLDLSLYIIDKLPKAVSAQD